MYRADTPAGNPLPDTSRLVDPWKLQALLMLKSGQQVPEHVHVNKHSLTYLALMLEEMGETCIAFHRLTNKMVMPSDTHVNILSSDFMQRTTRMRSTIEQTGIGLKACSKMLRAYVAHNNNPELDFGKLEDADIAQFLDGVTDTIVTACGAAIATGLPGAAAYEAVAKSNLSKANPATGLIDLDESGKWIKGPNWVEADLIKLLTKKTSLPPAAPREPGEKLPSDLLD